MNIEIEAFGSLLKIDFCWKKVSDRLKKQCIWIVEEFEKKYSRFRENTFLYTLNKEKRAPLTKEFREILEIAIKVSLETENYFDITLLPILENNWYGIESMTQKENTGMNFIEMKDGYIILKNEVQIDLWWIGKGYIIDKIDEILQKKLDTYIINFWWDIKVQWIHCIGLEDPLNDKKIIGKIWIEDESICASSGRKRTFNSGHHIINPYNKKSPEDKIIVYTKHKKAVYADTYATALFAGPLEKSLHLLENLSSLEWLVIDKNGGIYKSDWFDCSLF